MIKKERRLSRKTGLNLWGSGICAIRMETEALGKRNPLIRLA